MTIYPTEISFSKACPRIIVKVKNANNDQSYLKKSKEGSNLKKSKSSKAPIKIQETDEGKIKFFNIAVGICRRPIGRRSETWAF